MSRVSVADALTALDQAVVLGRGHVPEEQLEGARALLSRTTQRRGLDSDATIVAFAGATGSGKSSLFNALVGRELARTAAIRPTTSEALAVSEGGFHGLLDWLGVDRRAEVSDIPWMAGSDLVLIDLPDIDSVVTRHRAVAEYLIERADVVVWVVDPQKYADGVLHLEFLQHLREQSGGMLVVLNKVDTLSDEDERRVLEHLRSMLAQGSFGAEVLATSATGGAGVEELRSKLLQIAVRKKAALRRLAADLRQKSTELLRWVEEDGGTPGGAVRPADSRVLVRALSGALGGNGTARAAGEAYFHRGIGSVGWVWTRWVRSLRPDPLRRLHISEDEGSSIPPATSIVRSETQTAAVRSVVRRFATSEAGALPSRWRRGVVQRVEDGVADLIDAVDSDLGRIPRNLVRRPAWWSVAQGSQLVAAAAAAVGLLWLAAYWVADLLKIALPTLPYWGPLPVPTALLAGGLALGWLLAVLARFALKSGQSRTENRVRQHLDKQILGEARIFVLLPLETELGEFAEFTAALQQVSRVRGD